MANVSVEKAAVQSGIACCKLSIGELQRASRELQRAYQQVGSSGWKDQKYAQLGGIVEECCSSLVAPVNDLNDCISALQELAAAVTAYDSVSL